MKLIKKLSIATAAISLTACAANQINNANANKVQVINTKPPSSCKFVSTIVAGQGGMFSGLFTSNVNQHQGALNDLKNQTEGAGGNTVLLLNDNSAMTFSGGGGYGGGMTGTQTDNILTGSVYNCPKSSI